MLQHTDSVDSTYRLRTNPLNFRNHDGTDLILSKVDRLGQMAESRRPVSQVYPGPQPYRVRDDVYDDSDNDSISEEKSFTLSSKNSRVVQEQLQQLQAKQRPISYPTFNTAPLEFKSPEKPSHARTDSGNESMSSLSKQIFKDKEELKAEGLDLLALSIPTGQSAQPKQQIDLGPIKGLPRQLSNKGNRDSFQLELSLASPDLSSFMAEFSSYASNPKPTTQLGRKNTITSPNANIHTSPSKAAPQVFERMRSLRKTQSKEVMSRRVPEAKPTRQFVEPQTVPESCALIAEFNPQPKPQPIPANAEIIEICSTPKAPQSEYRSLDPDSSRMRARELAQLQKQEAEKKTAQESYRKAEEELAEALEKSRLEATPEEPVVQDAPVVGSPTLSTYSFDMHMANQLCAIPSPIMNAISFTPPVGATVTEDDDVSDIESIFSDKSNWVKTGEDDASVSSDAEEVEEEILLSTVPAVDPEDKGRLFVRVEGLSQLALPVVAHRHPRFNMTLDNGVQSVTIDPIPIKSTNPGVGQEFELVVGSDLQFILTFHAQMDALPEPGASKPEAETSEDPAEPLETVKTPPSQPQGAAPVPPPAATSSESHKKSRLRSMFSSSPKKPHTPPKSPAKSPTKSPAKAPTKTPQTVAAQKALTPSPIKKSAKTATPAANLDSCFKPKDMWDGLIGPQGEFGRCYLVAAQYEPEVYGRPRTFILSLFNEWGYDEEYEEAHEPPAKGQPNLADLVPTANGSAGTPYKDRKSARHNHTKNMITVNEFGVSRPRKVKKVPREPFKIASVQITLMYIPRVTMSSPIPTSIKNAAREFALIQSYRNTQLKGYLSQEGGDCNYWRRRWYELKGATLVGHTEDTHRVRNVLHLANVCNITDVATMTASEKSEMFGVCMYEDRSFRIAFKDGEVINFYADNAAIKDEWVRALVIVITYCTGRSYTWVDLVLEHIAKQSEAEAARYKHPTAMTEVAGLIKRKKGKSVKQASFADNLTVPHT